MRLAHSFLPAILLSMPSVWAASVRVQPTDAYGVDNIVLENRFLAVTISPHRGGRVADIVDRRTGKQVTGGDDAYFGCCKELVHDDQLPGELMQAGHKATIDERGPDAVSVVCKYVGRTQRTKGVLFTKTYQLIEGEPFLRVKYRIRTQHVGADNMALRIHNVFSPGGEFEHETAQPFIPIPAGPRKAEWNKFYRQYTAGWSGVVRPSTGDGVVCLFDWTKMSRGFSWNVPSIEWYYRPVKLKPGLVWTDEVIIVPTKGPSAIDHADRGAVYQTVLDGAQLQVKLYALVSGAVKVEPSVLTSDGKLKQAAPAQTVQLNAGQAAALKWDMPTAGVLEVTVTRGETTSTFLANPRGVDGFAVPVAEKGAVPLETEAVQRVQIARPLDGPEIRGEEPVKCLDTGWKPVEAKRRPKKFPDTADVEERRLLLDTGKVQYGFQYSRARVGKDQPWQCIGESQSGLGLFRPTSANFYHGGFFDLEINGVRLRTVVPEMRLVRGTGKAAIDLRWDLATATVRLRLAALGGDEALYGEALVAPKFPVKTIQSHFLVFPGGFHGERDRRFRTAKGDFGHEKAWTFGPNLGWLLTYDRSLNPGSGAAALAFPPDQISQVETKALSNYGVSTAVQHKPSLRRLHFVLWSMHRATNNRAVGRIRAEVGPALARLGRSDRLFSIGREVAEPRPKPPGVRLRILELATFAHGESRWGHRHFEEFERCEYLYTHKYGQPTRYEEFLRRMVESCRYAFRANGQFEYFLRGEKDIQVDTAYENVFSDYLARLYDYDLLVLNDFPLELLDPYERDLDDYVRAGGGLVFTGGYAAYGGIGKGYGSWKGSKLSSLLPVQIESVPDFVQQTEYRKGLPALYGRTRSCDYPDYHATVREGFWRFGPTLPIMRSLDWLGRGVSVVRVVEDHPIVAGVPLEQLAPDYHRVTARGEAETLARIGRDPAIVVEPRGKGRIAALTFSDARRLWVWPHTRQLYTQLADWVAGQPARPMVTRISVGGWGRAVGVELSNPTGRPVESALVVKEIGAGQRTAVRRTDRVKLPAGATRRFHLEFADAPHFAPGRVQVMASWAGRQAFAHFANPASATGTRLRIAPEHKRHFLREETMAPRVSLEGEAPRGSVLIAELIGGDGKVVRASRRQPIADGRGDVRLPIPAQRLAYGAYGYRVSLRDRGGKEAASASVPVSICRLTIPEYPIFWYGYGAHTDGDMDSYMTLGLLQRFGEQANAVFSVRGWGNNNLEEVCDRALGMGLPLISYCFYCPGVSGDHPKFRRSPHHSSRLDALRERGRQQAGFKKHPAVHWFYIDDEGTGFSETDYDKQQYEKLVGRAWPKDFKSVDDHHSVAKFHLRGGNNMWKAGFDGLREVLPSRTHFFLQSVGNVAANGGWIWDNFRDSAVNCIDLYPPAPVDVGQCFFYYNAMRCLGYHNWRPGWLMLGEYRETFEWMRGQWWLALGSGLESHSWYGANYGGGAHGIGVDRIHQIAPYDRRAMRYGPLLARWNKPHSKAAMYWSLASCARRGEGKARGAIRQYGREVEKACEATAVDLYRHDLYPDVITEAEILADKHLQYDAIVLAGVTWEIESVEAKLAEYARSRPLMLARGSTIRIPNAIPYDGAALAEQIEISVVTSDPLVVAEPLLAGDQRYLIVYNHQDKEVEAQVVIREPDARVVYDVFGHRKLVAQVADTQTTLKAKLGGYDGVLLALCPAELPDIRVTTRDATCGSDVSVEIAAGLPSKNGVVPVEVTVLSPRGDATVYGGPLAVAGGRSRFSVPTGINDRPGKWAVRVADLITGKVAETTFGLASPRD